jgi:hypothetical protein
MNRRLIILAILLVLLLQIVPYAFANAFASTFAISSNGSQRVFAGFLLNPVDGNSYLAKMQEGWSGSWLFTLPYSARSGEGRALFLFYLLLGHVARLTGGSVLLVFHLARIAASCALILALAQFINRVFKNNPKSAQRAFWLAVFGSGAGWMLALLSGYLAGDFWVAETYPFLSMYANPHFPLGLALILWIGCFEFGMASGFKLLWLAILGLCLAIIQPFGLVIAGVLLASRSGVAWVLERKLYITALIFCMVLGGPYLLYQFIIIQKDAMLALWNQQNITAALPVWDFVIALTPGIFLAALGGWRAWKERKAEPLALLVWLIVSVILVYFPFNLQRRFMTGLYVPIACLAIVGAEWMQMRFRKQRKWILPALFVLSIPTNIILLASGIGGAISLSPALYLTRGEEQAMNWIQTNTDARAVVLSSPEIGLWIPARTGRKVVYGHPFETINAESEKAAVEDFYRNDAADRSQFLQTRQVAYVFLGPREEDLCTSIQCEVVAGVVQKVGGSLVYQRDGVRIYRIKR